MDCRAPANRTKLILDIVGPMLVITDAKGKQALSAVGIPDDILIEYDDLLSPVNGYYDDLAELAMSQTQDTDPAYLLFTSGSTGVSKGVVIPHRRVNNKDRSEFHAKPTP